MKVPFNDLTRIHEPIIKSSLKEFEKVVNKSAFILNEDIEKFEQEYSSFTKQKYSLVIFSTNSCINGRNHYFNTLCVNSNIYIEHFRKWY